VRRAWIVAGICTVAGAFAVVGVGLALRSTPVLRADPPPPQCLATVGTQTYVLDLDQAQNAATIAAVAKRRGLDDHAVTVALATVMQESKLYNLDYGDRDSLGLFQQRPSQGWGTAAQVQDPVYAANKFYDALLTVPRWKSIPIADAAQRVQQSGFPTAYVQWEDEARAIARVLTGEVPAGMTCSFPTGLPTHATETQIRAAVQRELGSPALGRPLPAARGWTVSSWLVAHAALFGIDEVTYAGRTWTRVTGAWSPAAASTGPATTGPATSGPVTYRLAGGG
jgi:hypothetical protein